MNQDQKQVCSQNQRAFRAPCVLALSLGGRGRKPDVVTKRLQDYVILQCVEIMESENALALDYFKENQISFEWIVDEGGAVIRFAPIDIDKQQYASVHGENENISVEKIHLTVDFYRELIGKYK